MALSAEGVRKRFLFPSGEWDVYIIPEKNCPNNIPCRALSGVFAQKGASGAENFLGSPEGTPSGRLSCPRLLLNWRKSEKVVKKLGKMGNFCAGFSQTEDY